MKTIAMLMLLMLTSGIMMTAFAQEEDDSTVSQTLDTSATSDDETLDYPVEESGE